MGEDTEVGARCTNSPFIEWWSCPACYHDHYDRATKCEGCGIPLAMTVEQHPVYVATVVAVEGEGGDDDE